MSLTPNNQLLTVCQTSFVLLNYVFQALPRCNLSWPNLSWCLVSCSSAISALNRMAKSETEEMIEIEIDEREKQACLEEGWAQWWHMNSGVHCTHQRRIDTTCSSVRQCWGAEHRCLGPDSTRHRYQRACWQFEEAFGASYPNITWCVWHLLAGHPGSAPCVRVHHFFPAIQLFRFPH